MTEGPTEQQEEQDLPELSADVYQTVFGFLSLKDSASLAKASKRAARAARRPEIWRERLEHDFPHHYQKIQREIEKGKKFNFEELYRETYNKDYKNLTLKQRKIISCVKKGDLETLKKYMSPHHMRYFFEDAHFFDCIQWAIFYNHKHILEYFYSIDRQQNLNAAIRTHQDLKFYAKNEYTMSSAFRAAKYGNLDVLEKISTINVDMLFAEDTLRQTALLGAASRGHTECVKFLIEQGAPLNAETHSSGIYNGYNALLWAVNFNHVKAAKVLIDAGIDLYHDRKYGSKCKAIHLASELNCYDIAEYMIKKDKELVNDVDARGQSPLIWAASCGNTKIVKLLIESGADINHTSTYPGYSWSALQWAVHRNHTESAFSFLHAGANTSGKFNDGGNLLHETIKHGDSKLALILIQFNSDLLNEKNERGETPLHLAAKLGHFEIEKMLLNLETKFQDDKKYKPHSYFWAKRGPCRDLLKLKDKQQKYSQRDFKAWRIGQHTFRYSSDEKKAAIDHLITDTLGGKNTHTVTEDDEKLLKHSPELRVIYKHLKS